VESEIDAGRDDAGALMRERRRSQNSDYLDEVTSLTSCPWRTMTFPSISTVARESQTP
jgi:hypothetical protein